MDLQETRPATAETLTAAQAARLLHVQPKRVRALARAGRLPAARVGRQWLFRRGDLEALLARPAGARAAAAPAPPPEDPAGPVALSARNRLRGRVVRLRLDGLMAEVLLAVGDQELVSIITRASAERLGLVEGQEVLAVVKSTEVMIARAGALEA